MKHLLAFFIFISTAQSEPLIVYKNRCLDYDYACRNETQAADKSNIRAQVNVACTGIKCPVIFSVDPWRPDRDTWLFGARVRNGRVLFAADPTCPHARRQLRAILLRRSSQR